MSLYCLACIVYKCCLYCLVMDDAIEEGDDEAHDNDGYPVRTKLSLSTTNGWDWIIGR